MVIQYRPFVGALKIRRLFDDARLLVVNAFMRAYPEDFPPKQVLNSGDVTEGVAFWRGFKWCLADIFNSHNVGPHPVITVPGPNYRRIDDKQLSARVDSSFDDNDAVAVRLKYYIPRLIWKYNKAKTDLFKLATNIYRLQFSLYDMKKDLSKYTAGGEFLGELPVPNEPAPDTTAFLRGTAPDARRSFAFGFDLLSTNEAGEPYDYDEEEPRASGPHNSTSRSTETEDLYGFANVAAYHESRLKRDPETDSDSSTQRPEKPAKRLKDDDGTPSNVSSGDSYNLSFSSEDVLSGQSAEGVVHELIQEQPSEPTSVHSRLAQDALREGIKRDELALEDKIKKRTDCLGIYNDLRKGIAVLLNDEICAMAVQDNSVLRDLLNSYAHVHEKLDRKTLEGTIHLLQDLYDAAGEAPAKKKMTIEDVKNFQQLIDKLDSDLFKSNVDYNNAEQAVESLIDEYVGKKAVELKGQVDAGVWEGCLPTGDIINLLQQMEGMTTLAETSTSMQE